MNNNTLIEFVDAYDGDKGMMIVLNVYNNDKFMRVEIANNDLNLLDLVDEFESSEIDGIRIFRSSITKGE